MADEDRDAYLRRLGLDAEPPSADALIRLHRAQVERVPYETLWIHTGQRWGVGLDESVERIARRRRGGYCFHLNGAFSVLLEALGYRVARHVGGVHGPVPATEDEMANHLVLTVTGLPSEECPDGTWYVDAGLGDALHEPVPLAVGPFEQPPYTMRLDRIPGEVGDWHLTHDPSGGFAGMAWRSSSTTMDAFAAKHEWLSTAPESGFVRVLTVQRRDAAGVDVLRGCVLQRIGSGAAQADLTTGQELEDALTDLFGMDLADIEAATLAGLWDRMEREHERWVAAGRP
ncbi:MAG: arylamine N-acetyltransferase family protein [Acidimicrobiales bacterium]